MNAFKLKNNGDGTATVIDTAGLPLTIDGPGGEPEPLVVDLAELVEAPGAGGGDGPMSEAEFRAALATTEGGLRTLADPGRYASHLAQCRAQGMVTPG